MLFSWNFWSVLLFCHVAADYDEGDEDEYENEDEHANHVIGKNTFVIICQRSE